MQIEELSMKSLAELRQIAKEQGIRGISALRKTDLIARIAQETESPGEIREPRRSTQTPEKDIRRQSRGMEENTSRRQNRGTEENNSRRQNRMAQENNSRRQSFNPQENNSRRQSFNPQENNFRRQFFNPQENNSRRQSFNPQENNSRRQNSYSQRRQTNPEGGQQAPQRYQSNPDGAQQSSQRYQSNPDGAQQSSQRYQSNPDGAQQAPQRYQMSPEGGQQVPQRYQSSPEGGQPVQQAPQPPEQRFPGWNTGTRNDGISTPEEIRSLDSGQTARGILEVMPDGYGFIRSENYMPGEDDVYVSPSQIRRFNMKTGDIITGNIRVKTGQEKFVALLYISSINDEPPSVAEKRKKFEDLTPIFPCERIHLEAEGGSTAMRIMDLMCPIGKGQRGMIVSPPKAGKTTLLKAAARAVQINHPEMHIIILLIDERPEEVTDIRESIVGDNVEVIYSTFDEQPDHHKRVSEMVLGRAQRLVEHGRDVIILLDSITRLARAYNLTVAPSGRTLSGGLDPAALYSPKKFFGAARNMREGGSLTILATALVDTGSRMDDVIFEEFKGTGNMELVLDRKLSERRIFPAIDILKSGTRRDDLLLSEDEQEAIRIVRRGMHGMKQEEAVEEVLRLFTRTRNNSEFIEMAKKIRI